MLLGRLYFQNLLQLKILSVMSSRMGEIGGYVVIGEDLSVKTSYCKYEFGKLITALPPKYFFRKIKSAESYGGLGRTDYTLIVEED